MRIKEPNLRHTRVISLCQTRESQRGVTGHAIQNSYMGINSDIVHINVECSNGDALQYGAIQVLRNADGVGGC